MSSVYAEHHPHPGWSYFNIVLTFSWEKSFISGLVPARRPVQEICGGDDQIQRSPGGLQGEE